MRHQNSFKARFLYITITIAIMLMSMIDLSIVYAGSRQNAGSLGSSKRQNNVVWIRDIQTGFGINKAQVAFYKAGTNRSVSHNVAVNRGGKQAFKLEDGLYLYEVSAPGYKSLRSYFQESSPSTFPDVIWIAPEISAKRLPAGMQGYMTLSGYIVDLGTGGALQNARIHTSDDTVKATSDTEGYFTLYVPVVSNSSTISKESQIGTEIDIIVEADGHKTQALRHNLIWDGGSEQFIIDMHRGQGRIERDKRHKLNKTAEELATEAPQSAQPAQAVSALPKEVLEWISQRDGEVPVGMANTHAIQSTAISLPSSIKVGYDCPTAYKCKTVFVFPLEIYVQFGLDDEWIASWHAESLKAGAVAYRSFGAYRVEYPLCLKSTSCPTGQVYDICNTDSCQVFESDSASSTMNAASATVGVVLTKDNATVVKAEYSAENNSWVANPPPTGTKCTNTDLSCGNGYSGSPANGWPCLRDKISEGKSCNGHGRGMSQRGSQRWAQTGKSWQCIVDHYYNANGNRPDPIKPDQGTKQRTAYLWSSKVPLLGLVAAQIWTGAEYDIFAWSLDDQWNKLKVSPTDSKSSVYPSWSPDGNKVIFNTWTDGLLLILPILIFTWQINRAGFSN